MRECKHPQMFCWNLSCQVSIQQKNLRKIRGERAGALPEGQTPRLNVLEMILLVWTHQTQTFSCCVLHTWAANSPRCPDPILWPLSGHLPLCFVSTVPLLMCCVTSWADPPSYAFFFICVSMARCLLWLIQPGRTNAGLNPSHVPRDCRNTNPTPGSEYISSLFYEVAYPQSL